MTYESLIEQINNLPFIKEDNIKVKKVKFCGNKCGENRQIWAYFEKQKYPCGAFALRKFMKYTQIEPTFVVGVNSNDKDGWSEDNRRQLCYWLYNRFWIYLKRIDILYDCYVNGNFGKKSFMTYDDRWDVPTFTSLVHDGWSIQKHNLEHLLEMSSLKDIYNWYNDDVNDNLYKNFGNIEYGNGTYKELTTKEEFKSVRIGF